MRIKILDKLALRIMRSRLFARFILSQRSVSLKKKLPMLVFVEAVVPIALLCAFIWFSQSVILNQSIGYTQNLLGLMKTDIENYLERAEAVSQNIIYDEQLYSIMSSRGDGNNIEYYSIYNQLNNMLKKHIQPNSEIEVIYVISNSREFYICDNGNRRYLSTFIYSDLYTEAKERAGKNTWYLVTDGADTQSIFLARIMYDKDSFDEIGLLVLQLNKEYFTEQCEKLLNSSIRGIAVTDSRGKVILSGGGEFYNSGDGLKELIGSSTGSVIDNRRDVLVNFKPTETGWEIITFTPLDVLYRGVTPLWIIMCALIILSVLVMGAVTFIIIKDFLDPMEELISSMNKAESTGNILNVPVTRTDEIGVLTQNFNSMGTKINNLIKWGYQEQLTRKNAELKSLQSQINPHFLFNTLEIINWKAQLSGVSEISAIVRALSVIMNASIGRSDKLITLSEEMDIVDKYMLIIKNRFGDDVKIKKDIRLDTNSIFVPKLFIQPVIENSFSHGFSEKKKSGMIVMIRMYMKDEDIFIEIIDNGTGIAPAELDKINSVLNDNNSNDLYVSKKKGRSIGLENVSRRIKLFCGDDYGITIQSAEGCYTKIVLKLRRIEDETGGEYV